MQAEQAIQAQGARLACARRSDGNLSPQAVSYTPLNRANSLPLYELAGGWPYSTKRRERGMDTDCLTLSTQYS